VFPTCRAAHEGHVGLRIDAWRTPPKLPQSAGDPAPRSSGPAPR
jgi:hypothetical protein